MVSEDTLWTATEEKVGNYLATHSKGLTPPQTNTQRGRVQRD